jgi:hypothetical protein
MSNVKRKFQHKFQDVKVPNINKNLFIKSYIIFDKTGFLLDKKNRIKRLSALRKETG